MSDEYTGKNATLTWDSADYVALTQLNIDSTNSTSTLEVSSASGAANTLKEAGANSHRITTTLAIPRGTGSLTPFKVGTEAAVDAYPGGKAAGNAKLSWLKGVVQSRNIAAQTSTHTQMSITIECDGEPTESETS